MKFSQYCVFCNGKTQHTTPLSLLMTDFSPALPNLIATSPYLINLTKISLDYRCSIGNQVFQTIFHPPNVSKVTEAEAIKAILID